VIGRCKTAIQKYLNSLEGGKISSPLGRKKAVGERTMKRIVGFASNKVISARNIKSILGLNVSKRTAARCLSGSGKLKYMKMIGKPKLKKEHKKARMDFAFNHLD
jgi:Transposase